jgi:hypothetical protein
MQMAPREEIEVLFVALRWGATLDLSPEQRADVKTLCCEIAGIPHALNEEAKAKHEALELIAKLQCEIAALRLKSVALALPRTSLPIASCQ